jgi:hypothetical protein
MNAIAYASCGVILTVWSITLAEIIQRTAWLDYVGELSAALVLVICWLTWILAPLKLGDWKINLGE